MATSEAAAARKRSISRAENRTMELKHLVVLTTLLFYLL